jgi:RNA polymerase sigma-70 factor (ECF subfamily)
MTERMFDSDSLGTFHYGMPKNTISFEFSQKLVGIQRPLYSFVLSMLPHRQDAEDVLQETNLILCKKADEYSPKGNFQSWAFNIARYQIMAHLTKKRRNKISFSNELVEALAEEEIDTDILQLSQKALQICYELLPEHMKEIARLRFKDEENVKEISRKVGRPLGAVSATLFRIRSNLIDCVKMKLPNMELGAEG